jgi:hypothetical protein
MKMKWCHRRMGLLVLAGSVLLTLPVAFAQVVTPAQGIPLNNLVARVDQPRGPVPAECEQGLSPAAPLRVDVGAIELPVDEPGEPVAPPSGALRAALQQTQIALTENDRPAFNASLARTRALLVNYPTGGERRTAEDIVRLHEIAARLWDTQFEAPFFGETDPEYALVRDLPGFAEAVRRSTLTDDRDRRFYPTAESRDFVADLAGERLQRLGIQRGPRSVREQRSTPRASASPSTTTPRRSATSASPRRSDTSASPRRSTTSASGRSTASTSSRSTATSSRSGATSGRAATPSDRSTTSSSPRPDPVPARAPAVSTPAPRPVTPAPAPAVAATPPAASESSSSGDVATETTLPATETASGTPTTDIASDTGANADDPTLTDPAATAAVADSAVTSTNVLPAAPPTSRGRSVILPTILILIGLGVLIVLFRASK